MSQGLSKANVSLVEAKCECGQQTPLFLTVEDIARILNCRKNQVYDLERDDFMPRGQYLGRLHRWSREAIFDWIGQGCPSLRKEAPFRAYQCDFEGSQPLSQMEGAR